MENINIKELMTRNVQTVNSNATVEDVLQLMRQHAYSCIVIVEGTWPVGIITERDMVKILSEVVAVCPAGKLFVRDFMTHDPVCLHESASLYEALVITQTRGIRHLPIVDSDRDLVGLVTQSDISMAHFTAVEKQRAIIEDEIQDRTRELTEANEELKALALQDSMLRIGNRRSMEVDVHFTHVNASRYSRPYSIALVDVDYFKRYNDYYGHQAGDDVLISAVKHIKSNLRASDRLYRYGGEEFLVLMPETTLFEAVEAIHRLLENLECAAIPHKKSPEKIITVSVGIASTANATGTIWKDLVDQADKFLHSAKENGRNQAAWLVIDQAPDSGIGSSVFTN